MPHLHESRHMYESRVTYIHVSPGPPTAQHLVAVRCSALQRVAACHSVLQCVPCIHVSPGPLTAQHLAAVRCIVLQCVALCCTALQCVAACYIVLQCLIRTVSPGPLTAQHPDFPPVWPGLDSYVPGTFALDRADQTRGSLG